MHVEIQSAQAHHGAGSTERASRDRIAPKAGKLRGDILLALAAAGNRGLTATEATEVVGRDMAQLYSVAPRLPELVRQGYAFVWGRRGDRQVYVASEAGRAWAKDVAA